MIVAVDFDGTVVESEGHDEEEEELELKDGALMGLLSLKAAGHTLILTSCRANTAQRTDWRRNPLWRDGKVPFDEQRWQLEKENHERGYQNMLAFADKHLSGIFDAIDDGEQGKVYAHLYIDDRAFRMHSGGWNTVITLFGDYAI